MYKRYLRSDELLHYGVLGMKWGVRHDPIGATDKAYKKLEKIDRKLQKKSRSYKQNEIKLKKLEFKANKYKDKNRSDKADELDKKINKTRNKLYKDEQDVMRLAKKGGKWVGKMNKIFGNSGVRIHPTQQQLDLGKKYTETFITYNGMVIPILK